MTDRELLESAARAAGYTTDHKWNAERLLLDPPVMALVAYRDGELVSTGWNPLENDGDAFRLGIKFRVFGTDEFLRFLGVAYLECAGQDETAMWRRAIVLTVAAIGEKVK
ncbi:hypothetical protein [Curvibacter lanceolatus]|uniref:hypothetical protein n=1 Tax=Curvibacter lanceolatus TaxID=86182 RepID=UPI0004CEAF26|nr:hypothetical protein [Curvibacter lanceolatus]